MDQATRTSPNAQLAGGRGPSLRSTKWLDRYATGRNDLLEEFYAPALGAAEHYDRAAGYFRSTFYSLTGNAMAAFALRGGRARLLCSPDLQPADVHAMRKGLDAREAVDRAAERELRRILEEPHAKPGTEILAALLACGSLEIRFAFRAGGIFHDKVGVFVDAEGDTLSFAGSVNETWHAWHPLGNHESFEVFASWAPEGHRAVDHAQFFRRLWDGQGEALTIYSLGEAIEAEIYRYGSDDPDKRLREAALPGRATGRQLFPHQRDGLRRWEEADRRGILKHATGSGKTITALAAVRRWLANGGPVLIIVPSVLLLEQWEQEVSLELDEVDPAVLLVGGGHDEWRTAGLLGLFTSPGPTPRVTIATVQTAASAEFLRRARSGEHLMVVADEVHRLGSREFSNTLNLDAAARLGLSATPERYGDSEGTQRLMDWFGGVLEPEFTLADAIAAGRLTPYEYHVWLVGLSADEQTGWVALTKRIGRLIAALREEGNDVVGTSPELEQLLIKRSRIAKRAEQKAPTAAELVRSGYEPKQHWLVYCEDREQLRSVREELLERGLRSYEYHSAMQSDRKATLERYRRDGGVLVSIRCLDEGVDIPMISHAVILASSRNPREFVQRRGRVLRRAEDKPFATIHDLLVEPPSVENDAFESLARAELGRATAFAANAQNVAVKAHLERLCIRWGVDVEAATRSGSEDALDDADVVREVGGA